MSKEIDFIPNRTTGGYTAYTEGSNGKMIETDIVPDSITGGYKAYSREYEPSAPWTAKDRITLFKILFFLFSGSPVFCLAAFPYAIFCIVNKKRVVINIIRLIYSIPGILMTGVIIYCLISGSNVKDAFASIEEMFRGWLPH